MNKTSVCIIRRTAGLLGSIYQNNYSNNIFISVQLAFRWYLFTLPSPLPFSHIIRHSTSIAHTSSFHHSTRTRNHSTYSPHVCYHSTNITHVINTHYVNIPQPICECHHSTNTPKVSHHSTNTPHACRHSTSTPPTCMSFCQDSIPICHRTHRVSPFHQHSTLHISQISTRISHHSTNTPHVYLTTVISRCCYNNALCGHNSNSFHLPSSSAAKKETDRTMPTNK